jgi:hypothetical protein
LGFLAKYTKRAAVRKLHTLLLMRAEAKEKMM